MDCARYLEEMLSAHADGELRGRAERDADRHLVECGACQARLAEERELKRLIRMKHSMMRAPGDLRMRLRAALGELIEAEEAAEHPQAQRLARWRSPAAALPRIPLWCGAAAAAAIMVILVAMHLPRGASIPATPQTPVFTEAVARFDVASRKFQPNALAEGPVSGNADYAWVMERDDGGAAIDEAEDLARAYRDAGVPEAVYDFGAAGYGLDGGRIEQSDDGRPVSYTLYGGERGDILSICRHLAGFSAPVGARYWSGSHTFYEYQGHSICVTFHPAQHFVSIMVSREPVKELLADVVSADAAT